MLSKGRVASFVAFATERHAAYLRRDAGAPRPWSADPVVAGYHFCNVYRELDRTTAWLVENWYAPNDHDPDIWFAACLARRAVNWPDTLHEIGYPTVWQPRLVERMLRARQARGEKTFSSAYRLAAGGCPRGRLAEFVVETLDLVWTRRAEVSDVPRTMADFTRWMATHHRFGPFMAYQVTLDLTLTSFLRDAPDVDAWATYGPGSVRGLNRVLGHDVDRPTRSQTDWLLGLIDLRDAVKPLWPAGWPPLRASDVEHALCEYDKYERMRSGAGSMRRFTPRGDAA